MSAVPADEDRRLSQRARERDDVVSVVGHPCRAELGGRARPVAAEVDIVRGPPAAGEFVLPVGPHTR